MSHQIVRRLDLSLISIGVNPYLGMTCRRSSPHLLAQIASPHQAESPSVDRKLNYTVRLACRGYGYLLLLRSDAMIVVCFYVTVELVAQDWDENE